MAQTTLVSTKQLTKSRRTSLRVVGDVSQLIPSFKVKRDLKADHKFFINSLFCEMIEKI